MNFDSRIFTAVGFCFIFLIPGGHAVAAGAADIPQGSLSGKFQSTYQDGQYGNGTYTVYYNFPSVVTVGSNLTAKVSLQINELTGLQEFLTTYEISVELSLSNGRSLTQYVTSTGQLYSGAIWSPHNVTIPITEASTGLTAGQVANATVVIRLDTTVGVGFPVLEYHTHGDLREIGSLTISGARTTTSGGGQGSANLGAYVPFLLVGLGAVLLSFGITFPRLFPDRQQTRWLDGFRSSTI